MLRDFKRQAFHRLPLRSSYSNVRIDSPSECWQLTCGSQCLPSKASLRTPARLMLCRRYDVRLEKDGAGEGTRTPDPIITNDVLYQLSYTGILLCRGPTMALLVTARRA